LKVRVETIELPDGRRIPDYYQLEMPSFAYLRGNSRRPASSSIDSTATGLAGLASCFPVATSKMAKTHTKQRGGSFSKRRALRRALGPTLAALLSTPTKGDQCLICSTPLAAVGPLSSDDLEESEILLLTRDELLAAIRGGEIHILTQIALVGLVWQDEVAGALAR
jgi:ADP-ribose pyrophosphatase